jgi:hypothetical protein
MMEFSEITIEIYRIDFNRIASKSTWELKIKSIWGTIGGISYAIDILEHQINTLSEALSIAEKLGLVFDGDNCRFFGVFKLNK